MQKWFLSTCMVLCVVGAYAQDYDTRVQQYINNYRSFAVAEQKRSGVPAAITLAQGIHETGAGESELATQANNHFGIKCKREWTGMTFAHTDDAPNECFRKYNSPLESYKDHSDYLKTNKRYAKLFDLSITDYAGWAIGLRQAGYATNPAYAVKLIKLIEDYKLQEYTYLAMNNDVLSEAYAGEVVPEDDVVLANNENNVPAEVLTKVPAPVVAAAPVPAETSLAAARNMQVENPPMNNATQPKETFKTSSNIVVNESMGPEQIDLSDAVPQYGKEVKVNGLRAVYTKKGESPLELAYRYRIRYAKLLEFNDMDDSPLPADMYIYLEKKYSKGQHPFHMVKPGETMLMIAQEESVQLKSLREFNQIKAGEEPVPGTTLELQKEGTSKPRVYAAADVKKQTQEATPVRKKYEYVSTGSNDAPAASISKPASSSAPATTTVSVASTSSVELATTQKATETISQEVAVIQQKAAPEPERKEAEVTTTPPPRIMKNEPLAKQEAATEKPQTAVPQEQDTVDGKEESIEKDELEELKAKFDRVIYTGGGTARKEKSTIEYSPAPAPAMTQKAEEKKESDVEAKLAAKKLDPNGTYYTVQKGDTAYSIAKKHKITMRALMDLNDLDFNAIKVGEKLRVK